MDNYLCEHWYGLLHNQSNREQIFNDILVDREVFTNHLKACETCQGFKGAQLFFMPMGFHEFRSTIKELWRLSGRR